MIAHKELIPIIESFPRPDWSAIDQGIEELPESEWTHYYTDWATLWLQMTCEVLPKGYKIVESKHFLMVSDQPDRYNKLLIQFFEKALGYIMYHLKGIAADEGFGKHVALIFSDQDTYYQYISYFYENEGEFPLTGGIFLNREYGHFVFPFLEMYQAEATAAHELTHACLAHLPVPLWLDEGIAVSIENDLCGTSPLKMSSEDIRKHIAFWNEDTIQEFWNGRSFSRTDDGFNLSYDLARFCVKALSQNYHQFAAFVNTSTFEDSGEAAATEYFGGSLGGLIEQFFGPGNWSPKPETWPSELATSNDA